MLHHSCLQNFMLTCCAVAPFYEGRPDSPQLESGVSDELHGVEEGLIHVSGRGAWYRHARKPYPQLIRRSVIRK